MEHIKMDFISKTIDETTLNKFRATSLMNAMLNNQMGMVGELLYHMKDATILLAPIEENGFTQYSKSYGSMYDSNTTTYMKVPHYLNCLEVLSKLSYTHMALYHIFNNTGLLQDLEAKNLEYINKVQDVRKTGFGNYPELPNHFTLQNVIHTALNSDLALEDRKSLLSCLTSYLPMENLLKHADIANLKTLKETISPELLEIMDNHEYFAELKKIVLPKKKMK